MGSNEYDIHILIAEDDEDDLLIFQELILEGTDWDYYYRRHAEVIVDSASTREDIIRKLAESKYDLFFLHMFSDSIRGLTTSPNYNTVLLLIIIIWYVTFNFFGELFCLTQ